QLAAGASAVAPALLGLELANVLRTACKRQRIIASQAQDILARLSQLPIEVDARPAEASQLLSLALRYDLSSYDAAYLELALRLQLPIATQDEALADAARASGVGIVSV
ncbi:MAG: type II toxin-antitoxin system VapC family toxin, partial [Moraxellaceae bacterium]|nr:type II toxin-antitoxin system VapC family toxin [Moraxellaceae bacterium]